MFVASMVLQKLFCHHPSNVCAFLKFFLIFLQQGVTVVNVSATTFPQTLDWLHGYLLQVYLFYIQCRVKAFLIFTLFWIILSLAIVFLYAVYRKRYFFGVQYK